MRNSSKIMELKLLQPCSITVVMTNSDLLQRAYLIYLSLNHWDWVMFQVANIQKVELCHSPRAVEFAVKSVLSCMIRSGIWHNCAKTTAFAVLGKGGGYGLSWEINANWGSSSRRQ